VFVVIAPVLANQAGWAAAELGRQPWIVYGMLKTADAASKAVTGAEVLTSIVLFGIIYLLLLLAWIFVMDSKIRVGPEEPGSAPSPADRERWLDTATRRADAAATDSMSDVRGAPTDRGIAEET
jgi:cytochrome bd-type quinol oxidase subunit 1